MNQTLAKMLYVAGVTTFCTFLGCWVVLAHQSNTQSSRRMTMADEEFAKKAAQGGMAEVKLGQLAEEKATNETVKNFAKLMVEDHTKANEKLKEAASKENVTLPTDLDPKDEATYESLSKLSGEAFDRAYARDMVKDHQQDVAEFHREATNGRKEPIKSFAEQTLPTLQKHLKEARQMEQTVSRSAMGKTRRESPTSPMQHH
jgi:putative membrane protein